MVAVGGKQSEYDGMGLGRSGLCIRFSVYRIVVYVMAVYVYRSSISYVERPHLCNIAIEISDAFASFHSVKTSLREPQSTLVVPDYVLKILFSRLSLSSRHTEMESHFRLWACRFYDTLLGMSLDLICC